jgi:phosphoserine phosphatase
MIIFYDFDGTLTPYSLPQYKIINKYGYDDTKFMKLVNELISTKNLTLYQAYFEVYKNILISNKEQFNNKNICLGASEVEFNEGVLNYFSDLQYSKTGIKHYVVTSGFQEYVIATPISQYLDGVFGTTFKFENGQYTEIETLMTSEYKVDIIRKIQDSNKLQGHDIVYFGDGLTDRNAFEYVHSVGGKTIFVCDNIKEDKGFNELKKLGIIDEYFERDFSKESDIYNYIKKIK